MINRPTTSVLPAWVATEFPDFGSKFLANEVWIYNNADNTTLVSPVELPVITLLEVWYPKLVAFGAALSTWRNINRLAPYQDFLLTTAGYANFTSSQGLDDSLLSQAKFTNVMDIAGVAPIVAGWSGDNDLFVAGTATLDSMIDMLSPSTALAYETSKLQGIQASMTQAVMAVSVANVLKQNKPLFDSLGLSKILDISGDVMIERWLLGIQ